MQPFNAGQGLALLIDRVQAKYRKSKYVPDVLRMVNRNLVTLLLYEPSPLANWNKHRCNQTIGCPTIPGGLEISLQVQYFHKEARRSGGTEAAASFYLWGNPKFAIIINCALVRLARGPSDDRRSEKLKRGSLAAGRALMRCALSDRQRMDLTMGEGTRKPAIAQIY